MRRSDHIESELARKVEEVQELTKVAHNLRQVRMMMVVVTGVQLTWN
jgi:hypothetical protein